MLKVPVFYWDNLEHGAGLVHKLFPDLQMVSIWKEHHCQIAGFSLMVLLRQFAIRAKISKRSFMARNESGLIANMFGPLERCRQDAAILAQSGLLAKPDGSLISTNKGTSITEEQKSSIQWCACKGRRAGPHFCQSFWAYEPFRENWKVPLSKSHK